MIFMERPDSHDALKGSPLERNLFLDELRNCRPRRTTTSTHPLFLGSVESMEVMNINEDYSSRKVVTGGFVDGE